MSDWIIDWVTAGLFLLAVFMAGAAVGSMETAVWFAGEVEKRFECTER